MAASPRAPRKTPAATAPAARRLAPEDRERQIVDQAIAHFTRHGFAGSTRELAREIGVTQPLLYRYFPSKQALIERVYAEVFQWNPAWDTGLADRSVPLQQRLHRFYADYARVILQERWIRIFLFAGLAREGINDTYLARLRRQVFLPLLAELRAACCVPEPASAAVLEAEIELVWSLHASIFYLGVRKWIYGLRLPRDLDAVVRRQVDTFLHGAPAVLRALRERTDHA